MSTSLNTAHILSKDSRFPDQRTREFAQRWGGLLFWVAVALIIAAAVVMRLYHLDVPFDRDGYDEGVYWQSLRSMLAGDSLYHTIFYSQPPLFLLSTYPAFALFGGSLWSARFSIALISLLGFPGAYLLGKSLAGRVGVLAALLLLLVNPFYLAEPQTIQAEASSVAFTFLAIGFAFLWWKQPDGRRGACWAVLCGLTFTASVFCKLLCISTLVPIALLMLARARQMAKAAGYKQAKLVASAGRNWCRASDRSTFYPAFSRLISGLLGGHDHFSPGVGRSSERSAKHYVLQSRFDDACISLAAGARRAVWYAHFALAQRLARPSPPGLVTGDILFAADLSSSF